MSLRIAHLLVLCGCLFLLQGCCQTAPAPNNPPTDKPPTETQPAPPAADGAARKFPGEHYKFYTVNAPGPIDAAITTEGAFDESPVDHRAQVMYWIGCPSKNKVLQEI